VSERLNKLPRNWKWVALGDVATLVNGRAYKKNELLDSGPVPVLRVGNFFSNRGWYYSDLELPADKYCEKGDLLFAWSASFGPKIWDGPKVIYHYHIWKILTSPDIDKYYLYYLLGSISAEIKSEGNGIAMIHATKGGMEKRVIPLPPLAEQQKIAAILDAADQLRQKDQKLIEHYTVLGQSLFLEMFGDPVSNPKAWIRTEFGCIFNSIKYGVSTPPKYSTSGIPFIRATNIKKGSVVTKGMVYISLDESKKITKCKLSEGDLIIVRSGANTGDCGRIPSEYVDAFGGFDMIIDIDDPYSTFYNFLLNTGAGKAILKPLTRRAGQPHLNSKQISSLSLIAPPVSLQNQFVEHLQVIETQKQQAQAALDKSETLFNSLLQRAFKGELTQSTTV